MILENDSLEWKKIGPTKPFVEDDIGCIIKFRRRINNRYDYAIIVDLKHINLIHAPDSIINKIWRYWDGTVRNKRYSHYILSKEDSAIVKLGDSI